MPCRQVPTFEGRTGYGGVSGVGYRTELECQQACGEGACCNGTTCTVKPQCQCDAAAGFGFQGVGTTCSPNPCNIGACCVGASCSQRSEEQCVAGFNVGSFFNPQIVSGAFVGDNIPCDPNPCCPTCDPYILNQATNRYSGSCCRKVYEHDGHGACCPPGRDCCRNVNDFRTDGANGACCPAAKPYCCRDPKIPFEQSTGNCQQWPQVYYDTGDNPVLYELNSCRDRGVLQKTVSLPDAPFLISLSAHGTGPVQTVNGLLVNFFSGSQFTARFILGSFEWVANIDCVTNPVSCAGAGIGPICKPPGVTSLTFIVENLVSGFSDCVDESLYNFGSPVPAYRLEVWGESPCECNPLP